MSGWGDAFSRNVRRSPLARARGTGSPRILPLGSDDDGGSANAQGVPGGRRRGASLRPWGVPRRSTWGWRPAPAETEPGRLTFGATGTLVALLQETSADQLVHLLVDTLRAGTPLKELVAAAALANARTFGGEDYVGFHTMMALRRPTTWP